MLPLDPLPPQSLPSRLRTGVVISLALHAITVGTVIGAAAFG